MTYSCLACNTSLENTRDNEYAECSFCGSYRYISQRSAEEENKEYFEKAESYFVKEVKFYKFLFKLARLFEVFFNPRMLVAKVNEFRINRTIASKIKLYEIGFGNGRWIKRYLKRGKIVQGIDLSSEAVNSFQVRFPEYKGAVKQDTVPEGIHELIYANAIFEHLDDPDTFLTNASKCLVEDGCIVLGIPTVNPIHANITIEEDVNFWKPCHRMIYSPKGLELLLERNGFRVVVYATNDLFIYKFMNKMLRKKIPGFNEIRSPFSSYSGKNGLVTYLNALLGAVFVRSRSVWSKVLIEKVSN